MTRRGKNRWADLELEAAEALRRSRASIENGSPRGGGSTESDSAKESRRRAIAHQEALRERTKGGVT